MPESYIWLCFKTKYLRRTDREIGNMSIREVWLTWLIYRLERAFGHLSEGPGF